MGGGRRVRGGEERRGERGDLSQSNAILCNIVEDLLRVFVLQAATEAIENEESPALVTEVLDR